MAPKATLGVGATKNTKQLLSPDRTAEGKQKGRSEQTASGILPSGVTPLICSPTSLGDRKYSDLPAGNTQLRSGVQDLGISHSSTGCPIGLDSVTQLLLVFSLCPRGQPSTSVARAQANRSRSSL